MHNSVLMPSTSVVNAYCILQSRTLTPCCLYWGNAIPVYSVYMYMSIFYEEYCDSHRFIFNWILILLTWCSSIRFHSLWSHFRLCLDVKWFFCINFLQCVIILKISGVGTFTWENFIILKVYKQYKVDFKHYNETPNQMCSYLCFLLLIWRWPLSQNQCLQGCKKLRSSIRK